MVLSENISVKNIKDFSLKLKDEISNSEGTVVLDFANVKRVDLSVVQVVLSAGRSARNESKAIKLKNVSDAVKNQMQLCGLKI